MNKYTIKAKVNKAVEFSESIMHQIIWGKKKNDERDEEIINEANRLIANDKAND